MEQSLSIERILKELYHISGFRICIYDTNFHEIAAYPHELGCFCGLIQKHPEGMRLCVEHDTMAFGRVREQEKLHIYKCHFGLYEAVAPLYSFGALTGYLMMGQTLEAGPDAGRMPYEKALPLVSDPAALEEAISRIPVRGQSTIDSLVTIMEVCAQYITVSNRMNLSKNELVSEVHRYIEKHYDQKLTIDDLCRQFFCSRASLTRKFRETYHISIHDHICKVRLENGCRLLRTTTLSIGEIAFSCGYGDQNYFTRAFCRTYGMTPMQYRKKETLSPI